MEARERALIAAKSVLSIGNTNFPPRQRLRNGCVAMKLKAAAQDADACLSRERGVSEQEIV